MQGRFHYVVHTSKSVSSVVLYSTPKVDFAFERGFLTQIPDGTTEKRPFVLHYFLADDTVEILEVAQPNSGRDPWPALLKRIKLPKATRSRGVGAAAASALVAYQWLSAHRSLEH
jgi:hypothetical protein